MTVATITSRISYPGTGSTGPFTVPFRVLVDSDLLVTTRDASNTETVLGLSTDYTVAGVGNAQASVTLTSPLASGVTLVIRRAPALTQPVSIQNQGAYFPKTHEDEFDRLTMQGQSLQDQIGRSVKVGETFDPASLSLELIPETGKVLAWQSATQLGNSTLDSSAVALPGNSRTVATLSAYLLNNALFNVEDYGPSGRAIGVGVGADDTAAITAAAAAAGRTGTVYGRPGLSLILTSGVTFLGGVSMEGVTLTTAVQNGIAVSVGDSTITFRRQFCLPGIVQSNSLWAGSDTGLKIINCFSCDIYVAHVNGFSTGLLLFGNAQNCAYNNITIGQLDDNKINAQLDSDATGACNENNFFGGRYSHTTGRGTNVAGSRQVNLVPTTTGTNNNRWYGGSFEGDVPEFHLDCAGNDNYFYHCRWEATAPKVRWNGNNALHNVIHYGYNADAIAYTVVGGAENNHVYTPNGIRMQGGPGPNGLLVLQATSSSDPVLITQQAGAGPFSSTTAADYGLALSHNFLDAKATGDAHPRIRIDAGNGQLLFGDGTAAPTGEIRAFFGTGDIQFVVSKLGFYGVNPVSKATVTGSRGSNAALASLLTALAALGLIIDSSS